MINPIHENILTIECLIAELKGVLAALDQLDQLMDASERAPDPVITLHGLLSHNAERLGRACEAICAAYFASRPEPAAMH